MEILIPTLPIFFSIYLSTYIFAYYVIFRHWSPKTRPEAASCFISLAHGTPAVFLAIHAILQQLTKSNPNSLLLAHANTTSENIALEYSIAYFFADLLHYIIFFPNDLIFIGHHLATLFVFLTCRYLVCHGAFAILVLLVVAEVTSGCQNIWTLTNARKEDVPVAAKVNEFLSPVFYAFYSVARGVCGPLFVYKMGVFYLSGEADDVIPRWVWVSWMIVIVAANSVSILWVLNLWIGFFKERSNTTQQKMR